MGQWQKAHFGDEHKGIPNWSRSTSQSDILQLLIGNGAIGFGMCIKESSCYLWDKDVLDRFYTVV